MTAVNFPNSPSNGDTHTVGTTTYTYNSSKGYWDATPSGSAINLSTVGQHIVPSADNTYDLGSSSNKWRSLYVDAGTINIGSQTIKATSSGIQLPEVTIGTGTTTIKLGVDASGNLKQTPTVSGTAGSEVQTVALTDLSATTASAGTAGLAYNSTTGAFTYTPTDISAKADLAGPALTGIPTAPTASAGTSTTQLATTAYADAAVAGIVDSAPGALNTLNELAAALGDDVNFSTTITNSLAAKAPIASPTFTGVAAAPTASVGTNTTQLATTAFVTAATAGSGGSGGSIDLVADGAIAAGKAVTIEAGTGKVKQVAVNPADDGGIGTDGDAPTYHSRSSYNWFDRNSSPEGWSTAYDSTNNFGIEVYTEYDPNFLGYNVISGMGADATTVTRGSLGQTVTTEVTAGGHNRLYAIYDPTQAKYIVLYNRNNNTSRYIVGTPNASNGSVSWSSATSLPNNRNSDNGDSCFEPSTGHFITRWGSSANTTMNVGSFDGSSFTWTETAMGEQYNNFIPLGDGKVLCWKYGNSGKARIATIAADRSVTFGTAFTSSLASSIHSNGGGGANWAVDKTNNRIVMTYVDSVSNNLLKAAGGTISGTTISGISSPTTISTLGSHNYASPEIHWIQHDDSNPGNYMLAHNNSGSNSYTAGTYLLTLSFDGTTITAGTNDQVYTKTGGDSGGFKIEYEVYPMTFMGGSVNRMLWHYTRKNAISGDYRHSIASIKMSATSNKSQWVGINTTSKTDGQTATITLPGGINENQSGMTIEGAYYVQDNGDITTAVTDYKAGIALTAGKILVDDNTVNGVTSLSAYATTSALTTGLAAKAPLASPTFTGVPVSTTPATSDNSTKIATTAHVAAKVGELIGAPVAAHTVSSTAAVTEGHAVLLEANGEVTKIGAASAYSQQLISAAGSALSTDSSTAVSNNTGYTSAKIIYYPGQSSFLIARSGDFAKAVLSGGDTTLTVSMVTSGASLNSETSWAYDNTNNVVWMASTGTSFNVQKITMSGSSITTGSAVSMGTSQNHYSASSPRHILETSTGLMCSIYLTDDTAPTLKVVAFKEDGGTFTKGSQHTLQVGSAALFNDTSATGLKWVAKYDSTTGYVVLVRDGGTGNGIVAQTFKVNADLSITDGASSTVQGATTVWANSYGTNTTIGGGLYRYNMSEFNTQSKCAVFGNANNTNGSVGTFVLTVATDGTCTGGSALVYAYGGNVGSGSSTWSQIWTTNYPSTPWCVQLVGDSTVVLVDESRRYQNHYWSTGSSAAYNWNAVPVTRLQEFSISGTTITRTSKYELAGNNTNPGPNSSTHSTPQKHSDPVSDIVAIPNSSKVLYLAGNMYTQDYEVNTFGNHSNYATAAQKYQQPFLWQTTAVANNAGNWKGVAASNGAVGATINVVYPRGLLTTSGLTVGNTYYVQNDGSLGTADTGRKAGYAVTTTKLLVGDNTPLATAGAAGAAGATGATGAAGAAGARSAGDVFSIAVTVLNSGGNKYALDGSITNGALIKSGTYKFDQSNSSNAGHPLRFSTTENGTHASGSAYSTGVTVVGTPGSSGSYTQIVLEQDSPSTLYTYCTAHSGMGQKIVIGPNEEATGGTTYTAISSATTAVAGNAYIVDTGAAVTVTLPASAAIGDTVAVIDGTGTAATNNITIGRNSHKIQGDAADMTVSLNRAAFELVYYNATHGWLLTKV